MRIGDYLYFLAFLFVTNVLVAQNKKVMTPDTYLEWQRIRSTQLSDNGDWTKYHLQPEKGNKTLKIYNNRNGVSYSYDRVSSSMIHQSEDFLFFLCGHDYEAQRLMKRQKVEDKDMPNDTLNILHLDTKVNTQIANVKSFKSPSKWGDVLIYLKDPEEAKDTTSTLPQETKKSGTKLIVHHLDMEKLDTLLYTKTYSLAEEGEGLVAVSKGIDSLMEAGVYIYDFQQSAWNNVFETEGDIYNLSWSKDGNTLAFTVDRDTTEALVRPYELFIWNKGDSAASKLADDSSSFLSDAYRISNFSEPRFSEDGQRIFFGIAQQPILQDTSLLDDEIVNVEVWKYDDNRLYTRQENALERDKKKDFDIYYDMKSKSFHRTQDESIDYILYDEDRHSDIAIGISNEHYQKYVMWKGHSYFDAYKIDLKSRKKTKILEKERGRMWSSPKGRFNVWYDSGKKAHFAYDLLDNRKRQLTSTDLGTFYDEKNDRPMDPWSYGDDGFTTDEKYLILYDRYDIWLIDPTGTIKPKRITNGRKDEIVHRIIDLDYEESYTDISKPLLIHAFDEKDKSESYVSLDVENDKLSVLYSASERLDRSPIKAKNSDDIITTREDYQRFPNLVLTDLSFAQMKTISDANPQQEMYNWGSIALHEWKSLKGVELQGLLVLPEGFDPKKKYPLIVNFYERSSDGLNRHRAPYAHRSTINYSYYSSKGYVIFNPDIVYRNGYPGQSCYDAVMPGIESLVKKGFIDEEKIGVQGHSWGGYQIADLLTRTNIFACAESGAPVVNMVSAYGGIRWGSGMSRMFQYEKTQSRLGATLWENPDLYLENSPIFNLDKVTTPVLILHNDEDGAVPWYQGIEYFNGLRRLGKPAWFLNYNGEPHWPVKWQNKLDFNIRMEQFFDHYLMGKPMPRWMKNGVPAIEKGINQGYEIDK